MGDFHFLRPWWLVLIAALIILAPWLWRYFRKGSGWHRIIPAHLLTQLVNQPGRRPTMLPFALLCTAWIITSIALAGPTWERTPLPLHQSERGAVLVMDMSLNTRATDVSPDRLTRLKYKAVDMLESLEAAQVGLIAYAGDAFTIAPLTPDTNNILNLLPGLTPEIMPVAGNDPLLAMQQADRLLRDSGHAEGEIYWFSAGMNRRDLQDLQSFVNTTSHRISALIAGSNEGAPVRLESGEMLRDANDRIVMAELNADFFNRIVRATGGRVSRLTHDSEDIEYLLSQGALAERLSDEETEGGNAEWHDMGPYVALLLLPLVVWVSRRGVLWCLVPLMYMYEAPPVAASEHAASPLQTSEQRAQQLYQEGNYSAAAELFQNPMRRGNAHYRAGEYEAAIEAFRQHDSAESWYNLGNSYTHAGELESASEAYSEALQRRPEWQQAAENKQMVDELIEQEQSESSSGDDEQGDQQDNQQEQNDEQTGDSSAQQNETSDEAGNNQNAPPQDEAESDQAQPAEAEQSESDQDDAISEYEYTDENLTEEERQQIEQLLRSLPEDPSTLLRNRMRMEAERRQTGQPPRGARQQW